MRSLLIPISFLAIIGAAFYVLNSTNAFSAFERTTPHIALIAKAGGVETQSFELSIADDGAGVSQVHVIAEQAGSTIQVLQKQFTPPISSEKLTFSLNQISGIKEGPLVLKATIKDASYWENTSENQSTALIDLTKPRLELLSLQHVAAQGGAEFVLYKSSDPNLERHGVNVGNFFFQGFPASAVDTALSEQKDLFVSLFAIPLGFERKNGPLQLEARDKVGNLTKIELQFRIENKPQAEAAMKLSDDFLQRKTADLFSGYRKLAGEIGEAMSERPPEVPELLWQFRLINDRYRNLLDKKLFEILKASNQPKLWQAPFIKPMGSATSSTFGEKRIYTYGSLDGGKSVHNGLDLASVQADKVHAANDGIVALAEDFGIYGNTVLIDHGLGLFTLYGHLSSISVSTSTHVKLGQEIGRTGQTGLAGGDHLHFEFRLREVPVTPIEWWDPKWIKDNIDGKIRDYMATYLNSPSNS